MSPPVPGVPVADHADALGVGRPHGEDHAVHAVDAGPVGAELVVHAIVGALAEQVEIVVGQRRGEAVGILDLRDTPLVVGHAQLVGSEGGRQGTFPEAGGVHGPERMWRPAAAARHHGHRPRLGQERADGETLIPVRMRTQYRERITVLARDEGLDHVGRRSHRLIVPGLDAA